MGLKLPLLALLAVLGGLFFLVGRGNLRHGHQLLSDSPTSAPLHAVTNGGKEKELHFKNSRKELDAPPKSKEDVAVPPQRILQKQKHWLQDPRKVAAALGGQSPVDPPPGTLMRKERTQHSHRLRWAGRPQVNNRLPKGGGANANDVDDQGNP